MRKERQIGLRVGVPAFFALELEDVYKHSSGAHRALAFPDFVGLLVGMGLEAYRKQNATRDVRQGEAPDCELYPGHMDCIEGIGETGERGMKPCEPIAMPGRMASVL
jgi:hypothetical protein